MPESTWRPCWTRGEKIQEMVWIGKDVLAWSNGIHITFFHVNQKKRFMKPCVDQNTGDGACCLSAHATIPMFAFSEKILTPRILIFAYPSMTKISECIQGSKNGYSAIAFTAGDYLVSVGYYPKFSMILWSWRTGEKIMNVNTPMQNDVKQILRINQTGPTFIAQLGKTCGELFIWSLNVISKTYILKDHEIKLPKNEPIRWVDWCPLPGDPILAITDHDGHIYLSNEDGTNVYRIVYSQHCGLCNDYEMPSICWYRDGIILRTTFCQICYYKKYINNDVWNKEWCIKSTTKPYILIACPLKNDWLFYYTLEGYLMQIYFLESHTIPLIQEYYYHGANYRYLDFVYPWCHHVVVTSDNSKDLTVLECNTGMEIARISPETIGDISCQASHPDYPLIALTTNKGEVIFIRIINPKNPEIIVNMRLYKKPLNLIKFSSSGRSLVVSDTKSGNCFCISLKNDSYRVIGQVHVKKVISDVLLCDNQKGFKIYVIPVTSMTNFVGEQVLIYKVSKMQVQMKEIIGTLNLHNRFRNLYNVPGNYQLVVGTPYLTRQLQTLKLLETTTKDIEIVGTMPTNHYFRCARLFADRNWLTTAAYDGLIIVRNKSIKEIVASMMTHHRHDFGSVKGLVNSNANLAIALGHDGSLVGMKKVEQVADQQEDITKKLYLVDDSVYEKEKERILADYASLNSSLVSLLNPAKQGLNKFKEEIDLTWVEWIAKEKLKEEETACAQKRTSIMKDFLVLKNVVVELLNKNEIVPELERLPVSAFDLDKAEREHAMKVAKHAREDKRLEYEFNCSSMDHIAAWIKRTYWDPQKILAKSIFSILNSLEVTNFPFILENPEVKEALEYAEFQRTFLCSIVKPNYFQCWQIYTESQLELALVDPLKLTREEKVRVGELLGDEEREIDEQELAEQRAFEGMTGHRFIEQSPHYYSQMESYGFGQVILNNHYLMDDCNKLRSYFNKIFNEIYEKKEREMKVIQDKINRIYYIDSELKIMFNKSIPRLPLVPTWHIKEKPEEIIRVLDNEVKVKPYISPSQQEILDKQEAEAERIRQLLLADDFRERALMAMMDGVLEVRWEDIIKKDIPKPSCMLIKKPEDYTAEDIRTVKKYEDDIKNRLEEREYYKRILQSDYAKLESSLQEGIDKFNAKLDEVFLLRIKLEAAIKQMELRYVRGRIRNYNRVKNIESYERIKNKIEKNQTSEMILKEELESLENVQKNLLSPLEVMFNREKILNKNFRLEFPSLGKSSVELILRQYKRRPRTNLKNINMSDLLDLGKCVLNRIKLVYLPKICTEYLKLLDELDVRPSTLPSLIEDHHWEHLTRIRRQRIELELRIKAQQAEINRAERVVNAYGEKLKNSQHRTRELRKILSKMKEDGRIFDVNTEIQLVMRMGQVEIGLHGRCDDTLNAILIPRKVVEDVNVLIAEAGERKVKAVEHTISFQKTVRNKEWEHRALKMRIDDLKDDLHFVENTNLTREIQIYLKRRARNLREDRTTQRLERELMMMQNYFGKNLNEWAEKLEEIDKKIETIKRKNDLLDRMIMNMNVVRCEMEYSRDLIGEERQRRYMDRKMQIHMKRSDLIKKLQDNYAELLALQTEHELLRLRRYPALKFFRRLDDLNDKRKPC
ncbi:cilia- and flagella-associated protein 43-like [Vespa crabro]|uniref:cilia- and flagella-associated protein 43-like n=1 Tax=Vespa crabro TaxID=7445 RepID=UPI001F0128E7|nr:cilia- and flagella-associated protein 43-like [Vespa crabro]